MYWKFIQPYLIFSNEEIKDYIFIDNKDFSEEEIIKVLDYFEIEKIYEKNENAGIELIPLSEYKKKFLRSTTGQYAVNLLEKLINNTMWIKVPSTFPTNEVLLDSVNAGLNCCDASLVICTCAYAQGKYNIPSTTIAIMDVDCEFEANWTLPKTERYIGAINFGIVGYLKNGKYSGNSLTFFSEGSFRYNFRLKDISGGNDFINVTYYFNINNGTITISDFTNDSSALGTFKNPFVQGTYNLPNDFYWYPFIGSSELAATDYFYEYYNNLILADFFLKLGLQGGFVAKKYIPPTVGDYSGYRMMKRINNTWAEQKGYIFKDNKWLKCFKS